MRSRFVEAGGKRQLTTALVIVVVVAITPLPLAPVQAAPIHLSVEPMYTDGDTSAVLTVRFRCTPSLCNRILLTTSWDKGYTLVRCCEPRAGSLEDVLSVHEHACRKCPWTRQRIRTR
jgi:hypothetical protein